MFEGIDPGKDMKKFAVIAVLFFALVAINALTRDSGGAVPERPVFSGEPIKETPANQGGANERAGSVSGASQTPSWRVYMNEGAGFKITFPETWKGFRLENNVITGKDGTPRVQTGFGGWKPNAYYLFSLYEESKDTYKQTLKSQTGSTFSITHAGDSADGRNAVLCYGVCCKGGKGIDRYSSFEKARCAEVPGILETFKNTD